MQPDPLAGPGEFEQLDPIVEQCRHMIADTQSVGPKVVGETGRAGGEFRVSDRLAVAGDNCGFGRSAECMVIGG